MRRERIGTLGGRVNDDGVNSNAYAYPIAIDLPPTLNSNPGATVW